MAAQVLSSNSSISISNYSVICKNTENIHRVPQLFRPPRCPNLVIQRVDRKLSVQCSGNQTQTLRTCKNCKTQFDPSLNHPRACRYHTAHFGGSLRAYTQAAPWTPLTLEKFFNTGIVVGLKIPLILDALQHLTLLMMI
ncbi:hypothetical protein Pfo_019247, partial [Paulownia fortunei]